MRPLILFVFLLALAATAAAAEPTARTLDTVAIEGEIDVPQVLFISSRDHLRFQDDTGDLYRPGALDVILGAILPLRLRAVDAAAPLSDSMIEVETIEPRGEAPRIEEE